MTLVLILRLDDKTKESYDNIAKQEAEINKLLLIIKASEERRKAEVTLRKEQRKQDSILVQEVKSLKKRDSLRQVRTIAYYKREFEKLTDAELDSALLKAYEQSKVSR